MLDPKYNNNPFWGMISTSLFSISLIFGMIGFGLVASSHKEKSVQMLVAGTIILYSGIAAAIGGLIAGFVGRMKWGANKKLALVGILANLVVIGVAIMLVVYSRMA